MIKRLASGLLALARISGGSIGDGLLTLIIGVGLSTVGLEDATGTSRFTFGNLDLSLGFGLAAVAVGLYGISEIMLMLEGKEGTRAVPKVATHRLALTRDRLGARFTMPATQTGTYRLVLEAEHSIRTERDGGTLTVKPDQPPAVLTFSGRSAASTRAR